MIDLKIEKIEYQVDEAMLGECWNDDGTDDLEDFCKVLQKMCDEQTLFVKIVPITTLWNGAQNDPDTHNARGDSISVEWIFESIPFWDAVDKYYEEKNSCKEIYRNFVCILKKHTGKRFATITRHNDNKKNIYSVKLEIIYMSPKKKVNLTFFTKKRAIAISNAFLDVENEEFYWSESIGEFYDRFKSSKKIRR